MNTFTLSLNKVYTSLLILFLVGFNVSLIAQKTNPTFSGTKLIQARSSNVVDNFAAFTVVDFDLNAFNNFVRPQNSRNHNFIAQTVQLQMGQYNWTIELYQDDIFAEDFQLITIENGRRIEIPINKNKTYAGYLKGTNDEVRLTLDDGFLSGVVYQNGKPIYIEPLSRFEENAQPNQLIIYEGDKVLSPSLSCAHNDAEFKMQELEEGSARFLTNQCYEIRLGIATDASVFTSLTTVTAVNNFTTAVFNNIRPIYRFAFGDNIEFLIAQQFVSQATANDPFSPNTTSTDASTLLDNFGTWMVGNGFGTTNLDLGSVWVSRDIFLNGGQAAGVANFGLCTTLSNRTQIINYSANASAAGYACLVAHETGHNFHASHVSGANIMNPSCSASLVWDPSTVTAITNQLNSSDCTTGANALTTCAAPVANIGGGGAACVGQPITFKDNSQFGATRTWTTSGGSTSSGTGVTHTVTYNTAGTYPLSLTSTNSNGSNTANTTILVTNSPIAICEPSPNTGQGGGGIARFALANVDNTSPSGTALNEKLEDFACTSILNLEKNTMYTLTSLTIDFGGDFNNAILQGWKVYIDYNNDGDFTDAGEEVIDHGGISAAGDIAQIQGFPATAKSFTTPATPLENTLLRLRVVVDNNTITPCMIPDQGQIEDYSVVFKAVIPCPTDLATTTAPAIGVTNSTCSTTGSFTAITCASASTAQYSMDNGTTWGSTLPSYNAASAMTILTRCNCNSDNSVSSMTNTVTTVPVIKPIVTKPSDQTVTAGGMTTAVTFSGTTNATYAWTNDNTNTGIAASGNGNMTAYATTNAGVSNITVTPALNGCTGTPQVFKITVNAVSTCPTIGSFTGTSPLCSNDQTTPLTASGLTNMGTNNEIDFYYSATQQTTAAGVYGINGGNLIGSVLNDKLTNNKTIAKADSVAYPFTKPGVYYIYARIFPIPSDANCRPFKEFAITIKDTSMVVKPADQTLNVGDMTTAVTFSGTANATYAWTNDNVNTGIPANGNGNMIAYATTNAGVSNITITPTLNGCAGTPQIFKITVSGTTVSSCPTDVTIMSATISGDTAASATIMTQNTVVVNGPTTFSAPAVTLKAGFSVPAGQIFMANTTGCTATPTADGTCNAPFVLTCGQNYSGNNITNGTSNWMTYKMIDGYTGKEVVHKLDILVGDEVVLDLTGNNQDLVLVALGSCDNTADIVFSDNAGDTETEQITIPKDDFVDRTVFIVVDGWDGAASDYILSCTATSSGPGPIDPNTRISQTTSINPLSLTPDLSIYPNPATQFVDLDYIIKDNTPVEIGLYNLNGKLLKTFLPLQEKTIGRYQTKVDLVDVKPGMYFVMLRQAGHIQTKKLVVSQ